MMELLTTLRRLAEQHDYAALRQACLECDLNDPAVQTLVALADAHLGNADEARQFLEMLCTDELAVDVRVDVAAVHIALGELDSAVAILEAARQIQADHALLLARLAWCRLHQGNQRAALELYERSLTLRPYLAVFHSLLRLYLDTGALSRMAQCLDVAWRFWSVEQQHWPIELRQHHWQQLRNRRLDLLLSSGEEAAAESWVEAQRQRIDEEDWAALLSGLAQRLTQRDRHAQAEEWLRTGLRHYPENLLLYEQLAELAQIQGRSAAAIALLRRLIRLAEKQDQQTVMYWVQLSAAALPQHSALARSAAERALIELGNADSRICDEDQGHPDAVAVAGSNGIGMSETLARVQLALAALEAHEDATGKAEQRYLRVLRSYPAMVAAQQGLGQLYMQLGRIDEAIALFEQTKTVDPLRGYGSLISARRFPEDDLTLEKLERLARHPSAEGSVHSGLLFQLAAAWEQRQQFDRAFALAAEANRACRRVLQYDPSAHRQRCARIRHAFPKTLFEHRGEIGHSSVAPVFVVGMPRSGTTLVEQILAGHSRIHGAGELGTMPRVIAGLERWERFTGSGRGYPDCVDDLDAVVINGIAESVLSELRDYAPQADYIVDKLPHNFENIGLIRLLFPNARIISVRRDPRDIALSNFFTDFAGKHGGMGFAYDLDWLGEQLADHNLLMHHWHEVFPDSILEIGYEEIIEDPESAARRMLAYVGVDWEEQVLAFEDLQRPVRTASVWQVRQPLYKSSKARWRAYRHKLKPLIAATNRKITWEPIEMVTLPEPGWLNRGVDSFNLDDLDTAERQFKQLLHFLPEHASAKFMLGLTYIHKGHCEDAVVLMEQALERCSWNRRWRSDLAQAYRLQGRERDAVLVEQNRPGPMAVRREAAIDVDDRDQEYLYLSEQATS